MGHNFELRLDIMEYTRPNTCTVNETCQAANGTDNWPQVLSEQLPPLDTTCDTADEKVQRQTRRKTSKGKNDDNWRYCTTICIHVGKNHSKLVQCHFCQGWIHPQCVGKDDKDIVGIWTGTTCRVMPTHVHGLLDRMAALEALMARLVQSNEQLVRLVREQRTEIGGLRDGMRTLE